MTRGILPTTGYWAPSSDLEHTIDLPVLGIATRFTTNSHDVHSLVTESFGAWGRLTEEASPRSLPFAHVRVLVREGRETASGRSPIHHSFPDEMRMIARSVGSVGISDPHRAEATAEVTSELVADRDHFRDEMLQAITLALLSSYDRHFLHAAAVARGNRAVLLAAPSGTGKSTLAYLAQRSGLDVMSEDRVWIQRSPALRVWGWPWRLHLRPEAASHFPELEGAATHEHGANKPRHVVDVITSGISAPRFYADDVTVCLLTRGQDGPLLERVGAEVIVDALSRDIAPGFDRHSARHLPSVRAIAGAGGWRLRLSQDPHAALPFLEQMLGARG